MNRIILLAILAVAMTACQAPIVETPAPVQETKIYYVTQVMPTPEPAVQPSPTPEPTPTPDPDPIPPQGHAYLLDSDHAIYKDYTYEPGYYSWPEWCQLVTNQAATYTTTNGIEYHAKFGEEP